MIDCKVLPPIANSDHEAVLFSINLGMKNNLKYSNVTLENNFNKFNFQLTSSMIANAKLRNVFCDAIYVDDVVENFTNSFITNTEKASPVLRNYRNKPKIRCQGIYESSAFT